jgi:hypothetical protein
MTLNIFSQERVVIDCMSDKAPESGPLEPDSWFSREDRRNGIVFFVPLPESLFHIVVLIVVLNMTSPVFFFLHAFSKQSLPRGCKPDEETGCQFNLAYIYIELSNGKATVELSSEG